jgi:hypothetical protein
MGKKSGGGNAKLSQLVSLRGLLAIFEDWVDLFVSIGLKFHCRQSSKGMIYINDRFVLPSCR